MQLISHSVHIVELIILMDCYWLPAVKWSVLNNSWQREVIKLKSIPMQHFCSDSRQGCMNEFTSALRCIRDSVLYYCGCFINSLQVCQRENADRCGHAGWSAQWHSSGGSSGSETLAVRRLVHRRHGGQQNGGWRNTRVRTGSYFHALPLFRHQTTNNVIISKIVSKYNNSK